MNWGQFYHGYNQDSGFYFNFSPMEQGSFKNYKGGINSYKKVRKAVKLFDNEDVPDYLNPCKVIKGYQSLLPEGWADPMDARPLF